MIALPHSARAITLAIIAALFASQIFIRFNSDLNHDTSWYLYVAQGLLDGKELYRDFVEVNPPLAMWLTVPVPLAARLTGFDPVDIFYALMFLLTALALLAVRRYAGRAAATPEAGQGLLLVLTAAILLFAPGGHFGQREHLMMLLFLPWLMLRAARVNGASFNPAEAAAAGIVAAIAVCVKPHSVLAPIGVEIALLLRHRQWRQLLAPENFAGAALALAYAAVVIVFAPDYLRTIIGFGVKAYMPFFGGGTDWVISRSLPVLATAAATTAMIFLTDAGERRSFPVALLAAAAGFIASYFIQAKGYSYQLLTGQVYVCLAAAAAFAATIEADRRPFLHKLLVAVLIVPVLALNYRGQTYTYASARFEKMIDSHRVGSRSVFIATTNVFKSFPMVLKREFVWASRFPHQWLVPYVASKWRDGPLPDDAIIAYALDATVADLVRFRPDIVIVDVSNEQDYVPGGHFDYLRFWAMDARFAVLWPDYELRATQDGYEIYTRKDGR